MLLEKLLLVVITSLLASRPTRMLVAVCAVIWAVFLLSASCAPFNDASEGQVDFGTRLTNSINCAVAVCLKKRAFGRRTELIALLVLCTVNLICIIHLTYSFNPFDFMQKVSRQRVPRTAQPCFPQNIPQRIAIDVRVRLSRRCGTLTRRSPRSAPK